MSDGDADMRLALAAKYVRGGLADQAWDALQELASAPGASTRILYTATEIRLTLGDHAGALALAERGLVQTPDHVPLLLLRGLALRNLVRLSDAAESYLEATRRAPDAPEPWNDLGLVREAMNDPAGALQAFETAIRVAPAYTFAPANLAALYAELGRFAAAAAAAEAALVHDPSHIGARVNRATALIEQARHAEAATIIAPVADRPDAADTALYLLHYCSNDPATVLRSHADWAAHEPTPTPLLQRDVAGRRQRIGYVSPDFRRHSVSYFFEPLLGGHDRTRTEIFCYANGGRADDVTARLRARADHWHDIGHLNDAAACELIRSHDLDVLVDLAGHTKGNRLGVFARRAAPIQATALGYPGTTGLAQIDYRLCDALTDPPGTDAFASERLLRLPRLHCYRPDETAPLPAALPAAQARHITFGSFNKLGKVSDVTIALWAQVLAAVPRARLFLKSKALAEEQTRALTIARFAAHGVTADRLTLFGWVPEGAGHLSAYARIDVALDTFPYSGTTTTCEALWMGVPVLTLTGATHASRVSASLLATVGLIDWISESAESFVAKAVEVAQDLAGLAALRAELRERVAASPLCDAAGYAAAVEAAYRAM